MKIQRCLELKVRPYLMLNISTRLCFYSSIFSFSKESSFLSWNIHTRDTNCEDVIPEITFGPCSCWETVKRRKMHTLGDPPFSLTDSFFHASLFNPLCRSFHWFSTTHLVKVYREASTEFPGLGPREKFNMRLSCASRVRELYLSREYESAEVVCRRQIRYCDIKWGI